MIGKLGERNIGREIKGMRVIESGGGLDIAIDCDESGGGQSVDRGLWLATTVGPFPTAPKDRSSELRSEVQAGY